MDGLGTAQRSDEDQARSLDQDLDSRKSGGDESLDGGGGGGSEPAGPARAPAGKGDVDAKGAAGFAAGLAQKAEKDAGGDGAAKAEPKAQAKNDGAAKGGLY